MRDNKIIVVALSYYVLVNLLCGKDHWSKTADRSWKDIGKTEWSTDSPGNVWQLRFKRKLEQCYWKLEERKFLSYSGRKILKSITCSNTEKIRNVSNKLYVLDQRLANFLCKGSNSKYLRFCELYPLPHLYHCSIK